MKRLSQQEEEYVYFTLSVTGTGGRKTVLDPDQNLGTSCHKINDVLNPGTASERKVWRDDPKSGPPDDRQRDRQRNQQQA